MLPMMMMMKMVMTAAIMFFYAVAQCVCVCRFVPTAKQDEHGFEKVKMDNSVICTLERITNGCTKLGTGELAMWNGRCTFTPPGEMRLSHKRSIIYLRHTSVCETVVACLKHATRQIKYGDV